MPSVEEKGSTLNVSKDQNCSYTPIISVYGEARRTEPTPSRTIPELQAKMPCSPYNQCDSAVTCNNKQGTSLLPTKLENGQPPSSKDEHLKKGLKMPAQETPFKRLIKPKSFGLLDLKQGSIDTSDKEALRGVFTTNPLATINDAKKGYDVDVFKEENKEVSKASTVEEDAGEVHVTGVAEAPGINIDLKKGLHLDETDVTNETKDSEKDHSESAPSNEGKDETKTEEEAEVEALTQKLQSKLILGDNKQQPISNVTDQVEKVKASEDSAEKGREHMVSINKIHESVETHNTTHTSTTPERLLPKGVFGNSQSPTVLTSAGPTTINPQWGQTPQIQMPSSYRQSWETTVAHHNQPLPSFDIFQQSTSHIQTYAQSNPEFNFQPNASVVSPPGQDSRLFGRRMIPATCTYSTRHSPYNQTAYRMPMQHQVTPHHLYPLNALTNINSTEALMNCHQAVISDKQSTREPIESTWPLTPESIDVEEILQVNDLKSDEESSVKSPVENEEPVRYFGVNVPSPQSPFTTCSSSSSHSPAHSSYTDTPSPAQIVPDVRAPWTPDSTYDSVFSPDSSVIQSPDRMATGTVIIDNTLHPLKRPRSSNSSILTEAEAIHKITDYLMSTPRPECSANNLDSTFSNSPMVPMYPSPITTPSPDFPITSTSQDDFFGDEEYEEFCDHLTSWSIEELLAQDEDLDTVLHAAICKMRVPLSLAIIERLWKDKHTLNIVNKLQQTPLYLSVIVNIPILTLTLIKCGADPLYANTEGNTPLHAAAMNGYVEVIESICKGLEFCGYTMEAANTLFNRKNYNGKTALILAVESHRQQGSEGNIIDSSETIRMLMRKHASPLCQDETSGKTALHYAVELRKINIIRILLEECKDPASLANSQTYNGNTPLHLIVGRPATEEVILHIIGLLMSSGANVGIENQERDRPHQLAHSAHEEVRRRLHGQTNRNRER